MCKLSALIVAASLAAGGYETSAAQAQSSWSDSVTRGLICIHSHEGAWNANTNNGYYGGLQMDYSFMRKYGREFLNLWGTADKWPTYAQLAAGVRAYMDRKWSPWPNTARMCGLI